MADRRIVLAENGRASVRGLHAIGPRQFLAYQSELDDLAYVIDAAPLLGSATISSVARTPNGVTVAGAANTTTTATQRLKGAGTVEIRITDSASNVHTVTLEIRQRGPNQASDYA